MWNLTWALLCLCCGCLGTVAYPIGHSDQLVPETLPDASETSESADFTAYNGTRVNGGQPAADIVPYQISMQLNRRGRWQHFCGGSIISAQHILTAAHCVDKMTIEDVSVVCGTVNWRAGGQRHRAVSKQVHPQYASTARIVNDIAIVKVTPPFQLARSDVAPVALGGPSRIGDRVPVRLSGWGSTTQTTVGATLPDHLQVLNYRTITNEECAQKGFRVTPNELCALAVHGQGACVGDSGGPLIIPGPVPQLVGIVSYGTAACAQGRPDVYTRVSSFLIYINKIVQKDLQ